MLDAWNYFLQQATLAMCKNESFSFNVLMDRNVPII